MAIYAAQKGQLWIPYGEGIYMLQYYVAPFSITNTSYGSGSYGYGSYGSTVASGTTPTWGVSTPSISLVKINDQIYFSTGSLTELRNSHLITPSVGYFYYSSNILYVFPPDQSNKRASAAEYPDNPAGTTYFQDAWATPDGWGTSGGSGAVSNGKYTLTSSTTDLYLYRNFSGFAGSTQRTIRLRFDGAQSSSLGQVFYKTAGHGFSASYYKHFIIPLGGGVVDIDMGTLAAGGTDWVDSTITGVRFDFGNISGQVFVLDWIYVGDGTYSTTYSTTNFLSEEKILYPDMQNSPSWQYTTTYVKDAGEWKKSTVYVKVSGTWVRVS